MSKQEQMRKALQAELQRKNNTGLFDTSGLATQAQIASQPGPNSVMAKGIREMSNTGDPYVDAAGKGIATGFEMHDTAEQKAKLDHMYKLLVDMEYNRTLLRKMHMEEQNYQQGLQNFARHGAGPIKKYVSALANGDTAGTKAFGDILTKLYSDSFGKKVRYAGTIYNLDDGTTSMSIRDEEGNSLPPIDIIEAITNPEIAAHLPPDVSEIVIESLGTANQKRMLAMQRQSEMAQMQEPMYKNQVMQSQIGVNQAHARLSNTQARNAAIEGSPEYQQNGRDQMNWDLRAKENVKLAKDWTEGAQKSAFMANRAEQLEQLLGSEEAGGTGLYRKIAQFTGQNEDTVKAKYYGMPFAGVVKDLFGGNLTGSEYEKSIDALPVDLSKNPKALKVILQDIRLRESEKLKQFNNLRQAYEQDPGFNPHSTQYDPKLPSVPVKGQVQQVQGQSRGDVIKSLIEEDDLILDN